MRLIITIVALVTLLGTANAQCKEWKWGDNQDLSKEKYVLHNDLVKGKKYADAVDPHQWLLDNTPDLQRAIYINGEKIYTNLADDAESDSMKYVYADKLMDIFDMRIEYCGERADVLDRKALFAVKYYLKDFLKDKEKTEWLLSMYDTLFTIGDKGIMSANLKSYMTIIKVNSFYQKNLTDEEILDRYSRIMEVIDIQRAEFRKKPESAKTEKGLKTLDQIEASTTEELTKLVEMDCEKVKSFLGPKFEANPEDVKVAEMIFQFMLLDKCTDEPLWLEAGKTIEKYKPSYGLRKNIGLKEKAKGNDEVAGEFFTKALEIADTDDQKAEMEIHLGHLDREAGKKSEAREHYRAAVNYGDKGAYSYIGIMYMSSYDQCAKKVSKVEDRAVFLAAYKMFQLAGDSKRMSDAKQQFPSVEEIFGENRQKGEILRVGCWINETVQLDTRD